MKELKLNDDTIIELSDLSSSTDLVTVVKSYGEIDQMNLTKENIEGSRFAGEELNTIFVNVATVSAGGNVEVHINMRKKTLEEKFKESQEEQNAVLDMLSEMMA